MIDAMRDRVPGRYWLFGVIGVIAVIIGISGVISLKNGHDLKAARENFSPVPEKKIIVAEPAQPESEPEPVAPPEPEKHYEEALPETVYVAPPSPEPKMIVKPKEPLVTESSGPLAWRQYAVAMGEMPPGPQIAIVIDDAGLDRRRTSQVIELPGPLTISFLTYAGALERQSAAARKAGHEIMLHMPMQPMSNDVDPGPNVLAPGVDPEETLKRITWGLGRLSGYVGVNNHMGSKFTEDAAGMEILLRQLKARGLLFLDSRTSTKTVGPGIALALGLPYAERNVFLDNVPEIDAVNKQLKLLENVAQRQGYAVAIGHPKDATIFALSQWLAVIAERGFVQVPISTIVARRQAQMKAQEETAVKR